MRTFCPACSAANARPIASVVLPLPPFCVANTMVYTRSPELMSPHCNDADRNCGVLSPAASRPEAGCESRRFESRIENQYDTIVTDQYVERVMLPSVLQRRFSKANVPQQAEVKRETELARPCGDGV